MIETPHRLQVQDLHKSFGDNTVLDGFSLDLEPGLFGLLGPNGAGKSTLMKIMATLLDPDSGRVLYRSQDIAENPNIIRCDLGYMPQDFGVYRRASAMDLMTHIAVMKGLKNRRLRRAEIEYRLHSVNLFEKRHAEVATFSGGMRQRFGLAQALLGDPGLLIVDEPTAGLDILERQRLLDLLSEAAGQKIIILSTHITEDVRDLCTDMGVFTGGSLVARGNPRTLMKALAGRVWTRSGGNDVSAEAVQILSTRLIMGERHFRALSEIPPGPAWQPTEPELTDVYFSHMSAAAA